jgi:hypothetical protein
MPMPRSMIRNTSFDRGKRRGLDPTEVIGADIERDDT